MGNWKHRLVEVNEELSIGECANCGEVPLVIKNGRFKCKVGRTEQRGDNKAQRDGYEHDRAERIKLLAKQGTHCLICKELMTRPHYDHCHSTGKFRGFLCNKCNVGLGFFRDSPDILRAAADYLE